jgi:hypothetical protein
MQLGLVAYGLLAYAAREGVMKGGLLGYEGGILEGGVTRRGMKGGSGRRGYA